uniref:Uncharacterized protein n=1 Tax=Anguilla anguilla TaxID=7936 RepID=A0A0E9RNR4_ANGAN
MEYHLIMYKSKTFSKVQIYMFEMYLVLCIIFSIHPT